MHQTTSAHIIEDNKFASMRGQSTVHYLSSAAWRLLVFEMATLILVLYASYSIFRRSSDRAKEVERLREKVAELSDIVKRIHQGDGKTDVSEMILKMEFRDIRAQFDDLDIEDDIQKDAFEQLHFVEETISKSVFVPSEMPTSAESTL